MYSNGESSILVFYTQLVALEKISTPPECSSTN